MLHSDHALDSVGPAPNQLHDTDARILHLAFIVNLVLCVAYVAVMLSSMLNQSARAMQMNAFAKPFASPAAGSDACCKPQARSIALDVRQETGDEKPSEPAPKPQVESTPPAVPPSPSTPPVTPAVAPSAGAAPAAADAGGTPAGGTKTNLEEAIAAMEKDEDYFDYCVEQYLRCAACHTADKKLIGPPLFEVYELYKDNFEGVLEWAKKPGKRRPDYPQMLPIVLKEKQLRAAALYLMKVGRDASLKRNAEQKK